MEKRIRELISYKKLLVRTNLWVWGRKENLDVVVRGLRNEPRVWGLEPNPSGKRERARTKRRRGRRERRAEVTRSKVAAARAGFPFPVRTRESRSPTLPRV
jgi:hypothetical protein